MRLVDGKKLRRLRLAAGFTQDRLAICAGVARNTISRIESAGSGRMNLESVLQIAPALRCEPDDLGPVLADAADGPPPPARPAGAPVPPAPARPLPAKNPLRRASRLDPHAARWALRPAPEPLETRVGVAEPLTPDLLGSLFTAYRANEGALVWFDGYLPREFGVTPEEAAALGAAHAGECARFRVEEPAEGIEGLTLTVFAIERATTLAAQRLKRARKVARLCARLVSAPDGAPTFWTFESETRRPWALVLVDATAAPGPAEPEKRARRPR